MRRALPFKKIPKKTFALFFLSLPLGQAYGVEGSENAFSDGTSAFRGGDYPAALVHFERAHEAGHASEALTYNLAVTHYKLGHLARALHYFEQLASSNQWSELSRYNIALILQQQGEPRTAAAYFHEIANEADNEKLRYLAQTKLDELAESAPERRSSSVVLLDAVIGHDDNVVAFPAALQDSASENADTFMELLAYGQKAFGRDNAFLVDGYAFSRRYHELDAFDAAAFGAGVTRRHFNAGWTIRYGGGVDHVALGQETLATDMRLLLGAQREVGANRYAFSWQPSLHRAGDAYPQLEGNGHRIDAKWRHSTDAWRIHAGWRRDIDNREDLAAEDMFFSYSSVRDRLELKGEWIASGKLTWTLGARFSHAEFDGENRLLDTNGEVRTASREYDGTEMWLRGEYFVAPQWRFHGEYRRADINDTFELYSYQRNVFALGLEYGF